MTFLFGVVDEEVISSLTPPRHVIPPAELDEVKAPY